MSAGKGMTPRKGYNYQAYADNYDQIFRKPTKPKRLKTMKTNQDGKQPAPVLAWHKEAAKEMQALLWRAPGVGPNEHAAIIAAHDPHQETVRLLVKAADRLELPRYEWLDNEIRAHLAALQQEGAAK